MRKLKILQVNPTGGSGTPGSIEVSGDHTEEFHGKFYRNDAGNALPFYNTPATGFYPVVATTFEVVENEKYEGRYTVYTPQSASDTPSSVFASGRTVINVSQVIPGLDAGDSQALESDGYVTNISTYLISAGNEHVIVPPGVTLENRPVSLPGRGVTGWGETYLQNFVDVVRNFAGAVPPVNPFVGQFHYDTDDQLVKVWTGAAWSTINQQAFGASYQHTQSTPSTTWVVDHYLNLPAPHIAFVQFFVDRGNGPKPILPMDVEFTGPNSLVVSFSNPEIGYVLVKS